MQPFRARADLGAMAMKGYSAFPKAPAQLSITEQNLELFNFVQTNK